MSSFDLKKFFEERGAETACPVCKKHEWFLGHSSKNFLTLTNMQRPDDDGPPVAVNFVPLIALVCNNCGYLRLHSEVHMKALQDAGDKNEG